MKHPRIWKVLALVTSVGLMGAYVGHRALHASPRAEPPPAPAPADPAALGVELPVVEAPKPPREMFAGSKSMIDIVTVEDLKEAISPDAKKPESGAPSK